MAELQSFAPLIVNIVTLYWPYILAGSLAGSAFLLRGKIASSERRAAAEREQTFFLAILYIMLRSGKTMVHALSEAASRKEIIRSLSREAGYLKRMGEKKTLAESFGEYIHPSREFSLLIGSLGEDLGSGFGVVEKLEKLLEQSTSRESERWSRYVGTVETLGETIVSVILLVPLIYIVGGILGGFPTLYVVVISVGAATVFYVIAASSEPMHIVDIPRGIVMASVAVIMVAGGMLLTLFVNPSLTLIPLVVGVFLLAWGIYTHFRYVRRAVAEGEASFLLLDGVAARLRAGYPVGRSLEAVTDPRYSRYAKAVARGLQLTPLNRFMRLSIETIRLARLGGLGSEALSLMSRLAITIYLSFTNARARMKLYDSIAIASGAAIVAISAFAILPFTSLPPQLSQEVQRLLITPSLEPILPSAILVAFTLGVAVSKTEEQTIVATWRAGAGVIATLLVYSVASAFV
ncbi:hypothetical protein HRbin01_01246 [archaeon HR01]|nr:hypothetical protein HRbin01_01246 [archaeon HR01]